MKEEDMLEALPKDEDITADLFTAWDLSDGILQLLENVVEHAGTDRNGLGVLSMRIHTYSNAESYLKEKYDQYFKGYENRYKKEYEEMDDQKQVFDYTEKQYFRKCHEELRDQLQKGRFVDKTIVENYEKVRQKIETRRKRRNKIEYFLDMYCALRAKKNSAIIFRRNIVILLHCIKTF